MSAPALQEYRERQAHPARREGGMRVRGARPQPPAQAPLISIVTVVYNGAATLERAIRSVLQQTYPHIEHLIIDGGSTDGTLELIQRYDGKLAYWVSEPDGGIFDAMNKGVALAGGAYVAILNADDHYAPGAVECVVRALLCEGTEAVYGDSIFVVEDIGMEGRVTATLNLTRGMTLCHPALFVARSVYERLGAYDLRYRFSADLDFALRLRLADVKFAKASEPLVYYAAGGAAEQHLVRASWEAMAILARQAGVYSVLCYALMFLKRAVLRGVNACIRTLCGRRAYLWVKRRYYAARGFTVRGADAGAP